ncbi:MAG: methionyl-tRNA formyltransferase [Paracoccaceae bacterium]|jgi:methionyl-tRNA formyltransferase
MRLIFMGTPDFAVPALAALIDAGHDVVCVYSQPPRPAGRGHKEQPSPVQRYAQEHGIDVRYPVSLKTADAQADFVALNADAAIVAAYGLILPKAVLNAPSFGCINIHASLLPRWRGAAPIQRAILAGDTETGVTIMQMDEGLDTGPMLATGKYPIGDKTTASDVHDALAALGGKLVVEVLSGKLPPAVPQPEDGSTYAPKLDRAEGRIDWTETAAVLDLKIRALNPWPGVWCERDEARLRVLAATPVPGSGEPGMVIAAPLTVACGDGALRLDRVQHAGKSAMAADEYVRGNPVPAGTVLQ